MRAVDAEAALNGTDPDAADLTEIGRLAAAGCTPTDDVHASAEYRTTWARTSCSARSPEH